MFSIPAEVNKRRNPGMVCSVTGPHSSLSKGRALNTPSALSSLAIFPASVRGVMSVL